jgi:diguanylate cyclase (GGDEF)-like protein/PAS domain S-box-containing protein
MQELATLIAADRDWLYTHLISIADERGHLAPSPSIASAIGSLLDGFIDVLSLTSERYGDALPPLVRPPGEANNDPISALARQEVRRCHHSQSSPRSYFTLCKWFRQSLVDLVRHKFPTHCEPRVRYVLRCFDAFEIALCGTWFDTVYDPENVEAQRHYQHLQHENEEYINLFENVPSPIFLLDEAHHVVNMNHAATLLVHEQYNTEHDAQPDVEDDSADASPRLEDILPWLRGALPTPVASGVCRPSSGFSIKQGERCFDITCLPLADCHTTGQGNRTSSIVVILDDVTRFRDAELSLRRSEERFRRIFDSAHDAIIIHDLKGRILDVNESMLHMFNVTHREARRMSIIHDLSSYDIPKNLLPLIWEKALDGEPQLFEWKGRRPKDDSTLDIEIFLRRLNFGDGDVVMSTIRDTTARKRSEHLLRQSEEYHRTFFQNNHSIMLIISPDTGELYDANPAACDYYGYSKDELLAKNIADINVLTREEINAEMQRARDEARERFHFRHRLASGEIRDVDVYSGPIMYQGRELLFSVVHDTTEKNRIQQALALSEEKFRRIFENMQDAYYLGDLEGWPILINKALPTLLGYTAEEILALNVQDIYVDPDCRNTLHDELREKREIRLRELPLRRKDGQIITVECNMQMIYDRGEAVAVESICRDITDRKRANAILSQSEARYRGLFENSPISLWEADFSLVRHYIDDLAANGVEDFERYFMSNDEAVQQCAALVQLLQVNEATLRLFDADTKYDILPGLQNIFTSNNIVSFRQQLIALAKGKLRETFEAPQVTLMSDTKYVTIHLSVAPGYEESWGKVIVSVIDITERRRLEEELKRLATTDPLTGAANRRAFLDKAEKELQRSRRYSLPLTIMMLDIDHFKRVNDTYGHAAGDDVLRSMVGTCNTILRENDVFGRLGGEEFGALLIQTDRDDAMHVAERMRSQLEATTVETDEGPISFTVSIGLHTEIAGARPLEDIMVKADRALYHAKRTGRNKVVDYTAAIDEIDP